MTPGNFYLSSAQQFREVIDRSVRKITIINNNKNNSATASVAPQSGDWLLALTIANCYLRLDDEAVRVAVSM